MLAIITLTSCTDQGCIEANDFGEFQTQTLEVNSNATEDSCTYNSALELTDSEQGSGVKACLTSGAASVADESGVIQTVSSGGCNGYQVNNSGANIDINGAATSDESKMIKMDGPHQSLCINSCVQTCLSGASSVGGTTNPEPNWKSTDGRDSSQNYGVQILPGAEISISATGLITLSNSANYPSIYLPVDGLLENGMQPNYKNNTWTTDSIFDVTQGQTFNMKFSGKWTRPGSTSTGAYYNTSQVGAGTSKLQPSGAINTAIYDGAITLAAYTIPHPNGYVFDTTQSSEVLGTKGVPLLPDPKTWTCDYNAAKVWDAVTTTGATAIANYPNAFEANCYNKSNGYSTLGYNSSVDSAVLTNPNFLITNSSPSQGLGYYGGPIRWNGDGISEAVGTIFSRAYYRDFDTISATELSIPLGSSVKSDGTLLPQVVGRQMNIPASAPGITFTNNDTSSYMLFPRGGATCNSTTTPPAYLYATLKDAAGNVISSNVQLYIANGTWGAPYYPNNKITVGPGQKVILTGTSSTACNSSSNEMGIKFQKFQDIPITQSGFVRFTTLNAASGNCVLNGRILNPKNSDGSDRENTDSDYYEYDNFTASPSIDPLESLSVPNSGSSLIWSSKVFVRKGQTIRLSPISWNNTFTTNNGVTRQCGIGMVMQITPRPAFLCKGVSNDPVSNPDPKCLADTDLSSGNLIGCQAYASECNDISNTSNYCPYTDCRSTITCSPGTSSNNYMKTGCSAVSNVNSAACTTALASLSSTNQANFKTACGSCSALMLANAGLAATSSITQDKCYNLENYTGKVSSIGVANGGGPASTDPIFTKGAEYLSSFNGYYGNFIKFSDTNTVDSVANNEIYQSSTAMTFNQNSRLKFLIVTNNGDFRNLDTNYSSLQGSTTNYPYSSLTARGTSYNGSNGIKIGFDGTLQFSNGQWLEARICRETSSHSCRGSTTVPSTTATSADIALNQQPHLVELNTPTVSTDVMPTLASTANYKFDAFGTLTRTTSATAKDCTIINQAVDTAVNNTYYCHTYLNSTSSYIYDPQKSDPFSDSDYDELNQLRLIFKIKDPEVPNCIIPGSGATTNNGVMIPNPAYQANVCYTGSNCITTGSSYTTTCGSAGGATQACTGYVSGGRCVTPTQSQYNGYYSSSKICSSSTGVTGQTCTASDGTPSLTSSNPCRKQFYCGSVYANNSGKYYVTVKVANPPGNNISNIIGGVITPVIETMDGKRTIAADGTVTQTVGQSQRIYTLVVQDSRYQAILSMSMSMMIMFYGLTYLMGVTDLSSSDLINRCIKIAVIYLFASPTGWYWFNMFAVKWFKDGTDYLAFMMASSFDDSTALAQAISINDYYDKSVLFSSVDKVFGMFFSQAVQKKISALLFASIFGWVYLWIIYLSFMLYVYAVGYAVLYYLTAQIFISILFTLGPIFFIFTLFNQTKGMFDSWLNQLIGFSLQQIFLLTTLAFFNMMMYEVLKMSLGYRICWDEVWSINIITRISLLSFWTVASLPPKVNTQSAVGEIGHPEGIPSLFSILFIWVVASLMKNFIGFMTNLGASIGGSLSASAMASGALKAINDAKNYSSKKFNDITKGAINEPMKRLDAALFDSGEHAEKARKARQEKNRQDQGKKESLNKAGNEAMSKFKRENAAEYSKMTEEQKKAALTKAKDEGMKKEAKKLGISDDELKKLKSDKGLKYEGSNVLVAAAQAARQKAGFGGGTLSSSLNDSKISTKMSFSEAKEGMSKMSASERKDFKEQAAKGNVAVDKSTSQKIIGAAQTAANLTAKPAVGLGVGAAAGVAGLAGDTASALASLATGGKVGNTNFNSTRANAASAKEKAAGAGKAMYEGAGSAKDSLVKAAKGLAGKASNAVGGNEYAEARKQLEDSGKIRRMAEAETTLFGKRLAIGTNFARSDKEKQMINDQMKKNREEKATSMPTKNDSMTIAKLDALDKGMTLNEEGKVGRRDAALFGPGGMKHAISSQFTKGAEAEKHATEGVAAVAGKLAEKGGSIETDKATKASLEKTKDVAQQASVAIQKVAKIDEQLQGAPVKQTMAQRALNAITGKEPPRTPPASGEEKARLEAEKTAVIANYEADGGTFFKDKQALEEQKAIQSSSSSTEEQKAQATEAIKDITGKENYISSEGGGLDAANSMYQQADQQIKNIDARLDKTQPVNTASQASKAAFEKAMGSESVKAVEAKYEKLSNFDKATGGRFNQEARAVIQDHGKIQKMKKDFAKLGKLSDKDMSTNLRKTDAIQKDEHGKDMISLDGEKVHETANRASDKHNEFADKYSKGLDFESVSAPAPEPAAAAPATSDTAAEPEAAPPTTTAGGTQLGTIAEDDEERDE